MGVYSVDQALPYLVTATGVKLHWAPGHCESVYDFTVSGGQIRRSVLGLTEARAAEWLATDPRRSRCGRCHPPMPYGRLRVAR